MPSRLACTTVQLDVPARSELVGLVRLVVSALAARVGFDDELVSDLKLAVSEACTNAIESYPEGGTDRRVTVGWAANDEQVEIWIRDRGRGFDPAQVHTAPPAGDPRRLDFERGLGIPLMSALVDHLSFSPAEPGTTVTLTLRHDRDLRLGG